MNGHEFIETLNSTVAVSEQSLNELKDVVAKYPYFSMARLACLRQLCMSGNPDFGKELPHAAVYAKSSEWLYEYIYRKEAAVAEVLSETAAAEVPETAAPKHEEAAPAQAEAHEVQPSAETHDAVQTEPKANEVEEKQAEAESKDGMFELIGDDEKAVKSELDEVLDQKLYTLSEQETHSENPSDLIEQFLTINPRIVPKPDLPQVNEDISLSSLEDDGEIVTEMLAKIYVSQGLISKAINAYNKLSLKYPEKKAYFVAEIEKLEK